MTTIISFIKCFYFYFIKLYKTPSINNVDDPETDGLIQERNVIFMELIFHFHRTMDIIIG